jgi:hypothetical protein
MNRLKQLERAGWTWGDVKYGEAGLEELRVQAAALAGGEGRASDIVSMGRGWQIIVAPAPGAMAARVERKPRRYMAR